MPSFDKESFLDFIINNDVVVFFESEVTLKSGKKSYWYVNWRKITSDVCLMDVLTDHILNFLSDKNIEVDSFYGVPDGATKLGVILSYKNAKLKPNFVKGKHTLSQGRVIPKEHGDPENRFFIGKPSGRAVIVEDVATTGGSLLKQVEIFIDMGIDLKAVIVLTDREDVNLHSILKQKGIAYYPMSKASEFVLKTAKRVEASKLVLEKLREEFDVD